MINLELEKADKMREFRKKYNLSQLKASIKLGYTYSAWQAYESNKRPIKMHVLINMSNYEKAKKYKKLYNKLLIKQQ